MAHENMPNPIEVYESAVKALVPLMAGVTAAQLSSNTPCTEWSVQSLINHALAVQNFANSTLSKDSFDMSTMGAVDHALPSEGAGAAFKSITDTTLATLKKVNLEETVETPFGAMPVGNFIMIDGLFSSSAYQGLHKMLDATVMRHEAIASNLANLETPNYKRIDVDSSFGAQLSRAIGEGDTKRIARLEPKLVVDKTALAANRDGNTVQLEQEMLALQKNAVAHRMQVQFITGRLMKIKSAIQGKVG